MEPPKGPRTGCAFYPLLSVRIISVRVREGERERERGPLCSLPAPPVKLSVGVRCKSPLYTCLCVCVCIRRTPPVTWTEASACSHTCRQELQPPRRRLTMEREPLFFSGTYPAALILCSGTSHSLCMFACSSAFDGPPGLIPAMQSLSQLSNVSLGGACGRKTPAGKIGWRKEPSVFRIRGVFLWLCRTTRPRVVCAALSAISYYGSETPSQCDVDWAWTDPTRNDNFSSCSCHT